MNRFAELLDRLAYEPARNAKLRLMTEYFRSSADPERGWALAALTGALSFPHAKPALIRNLIVERTDPVLFALSHDYVGDLSETIALMWPAPKAEPGSAAVAEKSELSLTSVVETLTTLGKAQLPRTLAQWLDALDETGRWALIKLVTGGLRVGVSARLAKAAVGALGGKDAHEIELLWPALAPPYRELFAWLEGRAEKPASDDPAPFRPPMLAHAIDEGDLAALDPADFLAEWKWDGIRVQAVAAARRNEDDGIAAARLYSRTGDNISKSFPDLIEALHLPGAIDGELLIMRDGRVQSFNVLQQRLNRKTVTPQLTAEFPAHLRAYDLLADGDQDLRGLPFVERRARLEDFIARLNDPRVDVSPLVSFADWAELTQARKLPEQAGAGTDAPAVEGIMLKRREALYLPGRPKGPWWKWKRDPFIIDAVLMYAQRGHGKRSSYYSDYTFGVWTGSHGGEELVPVGKAYFGFTDEELLQIDRFVRRNTTDRFGPVREVVHKSDQGLVLEVAFEGLQRSTRHKSGIAMRFPRINRLRWDKPPGEADRLERLETIITQIERGRASWAVGARYHRLRCRSAAAASATCPPCSRWSVRCSPAMCCRAAASVTSSPRRMPRCSLRRRAGNSPAMCLCCIRRDPGLPGSTRSRSRRTPPAAVSDRGSSRRRNRRQRGAAAAPCGLKCTITTHARLRVMRSRAIACSDGTMTIMTITATHCASKRRSALSPAGPDVSRNGLTPVPESVLMVDIMHGAVANRVASGYDDLRGA